ncbi:MAG TPA: sugar nucleotide-binding protein [Verrucomicrobiae bacterium]
MILLLGATGYVGQAFSSELRRRKLSFIPLTRKAIDYTSFDALFDYIRKMKPEFVINAAGYAPNTNLEVSESAHWEALCANALLPQTIARACLMTNTPWGHVSSGNIYAGAKIENDQGQMRIERDLNRLEIRKLFTRYPEKILGFTEWDEPNLSFRRAPCNFYSGTKALAEEAIHGVGKYYVWRPGTFFDERNDSRNLLSKLQQHKKVQDHLIAVTQLNDFVRACLGLWEHGAAFGIYNVVNGGAITTRRMVELIQQILKPQREFEFLENSDEAHSHPVMSLCANCVLDASKLAASGIKMRSAEEALKGSLQKWHAADSSMAYTSAEVQPVNAALSGMALFEKLFARPT